MIVVADTGPLIFLGKLRQLDLVPELFGGDIRVPRPVASELLRPGLDPSEADVLRAFLDRCKVETVSRPRAFARAMSAADNAALTLAVRRKAAVLLCDERVTRLMAETEGIRPVGTLGVLMRATRAELLSARDTRCLVDNVVSDHGFRIGVEVYRAVIARLDTGG